MARVYDFVSCIGPNCRASWATQEYFGDYTTRPFDSWVTPFYASLELLKLGEPPRISNDDLVRIQLNDDLDTIYNRRLGLYHHHDFPNAPGTLKIAADWRDTTADVAQKYTFLFQRFWRDFHEAKNPLLVVCGMSTFRSDIQSGHEAVIHNGYQPPPFDVGVPRAEDAAKLIRNVFPEKRVSVINIYPGSKRVAAGNEDTFLYIGVDDGTRPPYLKLNAWQHPVNVFRDGFSHFEMSIAHEDAQHGMFDRTAVWGASVFREMRIGILTEKAEKLLASAAEPDVHKAMKYLRGAAQLGPNAEQTAAIVALAKRHDIDLDSDEDIRKVVKFAGAL